MLKRIIGLGIVGMSAGMVAAAATAMNLKRSLVPTTDPSADEIVAVAIFGPLEFHSTSTELPWRPARVLVRRRRPRPARRDAGPGRRHAPGPGRLRRRPDPRADRLEGRLDRQGMGGLQDIRDAKGYAADAPELVIEGVLIAGGFAVSSELDRGADWEADLQALRDNNELELEADTTPVS